MRRVALLAGSLALFGAAALSAAPRAARTAADSPPASPDVQPQVARVTVHCPAGNRDAFVTPPQVRVRTGGTVEWRLGPQVESDSIVISLKDGGQSWPFSGTPSRGGTVAIATNAGAPGTYGYNVTLLCRVGGGEPQRVVIDPDIIITP